MKYLQLFILTFFLLISKAQTSNTYQADLTALYKTLQKTPSFKDQVKGQDLNAYNRIYEKLLSDTVKNPSDYQYFYNLAQLFFPIRDNHLSFYQIANFPASSAFPAFKGNIDSLQYFLEAKPLDSLEGIYHYGHYYSVGLFKTNNEYMGVVLDTKVPNWKRGEIAIRLYEYLPNNFKAIYAHPKFKNLMLYPIEKYTHHSLVNSYFYASFSEAIYSKRINENDFTNLPKSTQDFKLVTIESGIQYVYMKHFSADINKMRKSKEFYDSIKNLLTEPNLILDLRNNEGGANKVSKKFLDLLKQYTKKGKVFVLINNGTLSQGEIFTLQLLELKNVKTLGQTTKGMLTYGSNYGNRTKLPSGSFEAYLTDMKGKGAKKLLPYENYGIQPDIILTDTKDWIEQTIEIIRKK